MYYHLTGYSFCAKCPLFQKAYIDFELFLIPLITPAPILRLTLPLAYRLVPTLPDFPRFLTFLSYSPDPI